MEEEDHHITTHHGRKKEGKGSPSVTTRHCLPLSSTGEWKVVGRCVCKGQERGGGGGMEWEMSHLPQPAPPLHTHATPPGKALNAMERI